MRSIFRIGVEDVQYIALERVGRKLSIDELYQVRKGVEFGLECWEDVVFAAIDDLEIVKENVKNT